MAISRRLRFEVLRRDGHACRYCGAMAPDAKLTVDHVIPTALGGSDDPDNLVAACAECNAGKSSIQPNSDLIADVATDALRWANAMEAAASNLMSEREVLDGFLERFEAKWNEWTFEYNVSVPPPPVEPTGDILVDKWHQAVLFSDESRPVGLENGVLFIQVKQGYLTEVRRDLALMRSRRKFATVTGVPYDSIEIVSGWDGAIPRPSYPTTRKERSTLPLPDAWQSSIERFISNRLPETEIHRFIDIAMAKPRLSAIETWRYFCGCCWRAITDLQEDARRILETTEQ